MIYIAGPARADKKVWYQYVIYEVSDGPERFPPTDEFDIYFEALAHLERIVNGFEGESGCLLYINNDDHLIKIIANKILNNAKEDVLFTYIPDRLSDSDVYHRLGKLYPYVDKRDPE